MSNPKEGDLRVWWIPQVPMEGFRVDVNSVQEGVKLTHILADYDAFQFENNVKPDYSNAGGLEMFEDGDWVGWEIGVTDTNGEYWHFEDPEEYLEWMEENEQNITST